MKILKVVSIFLFITFLAIGCGSSGGDPDPAAPNPNPSSSIKSGDYNPLATGNTWVYNLGTVRVVDDFHEFSGGTGQRIENMSLVCVPYDGFMAHTEDGEAVLLGLYDRDEDLYFEMPNQDSLGMFPNDVQVGDSWVFDPKEDFTITYTYMGMESVTVPAGTFTDSIKIRTVIVDTDANPGTYTTFFWYAKGVGLVKAERIYESPIGHSGCNMVTSANPLAELQSAVINGISINSGGGNPTTTYKTADYFPMGQGDTWTYDNNEIHQISGTEPVNEVIAIKFLADAGEKDEYLLVDIYNGTVRFHKIADLDDIEGCGWSQNVFTPPLVMIPAELSLGVKHTPSTTAYYSNCSGLEKTQTVTLTGTLEAVEDVTVPAGTFKNCLKYRIVSSMLNDQGETDNSDQTWWMAKEVGLVKTIENGRTEKLSSATVGGVSYP